MSRSSRFRTTSSLGYSGAYSSGLSGSYGGGMSSSGYFSPTLGSVPSTSLGTTGYSSGSTGSYLGRVGSSLYGTGAAPSATTPYSSSYSGARSLGFTSTNNDYTPPGGGTTSYSSPRRRYGGATTDSNLSDRMNNSSTVQISSPTYGTKTPSRSAVSYRGSRSHSELSPTGLLLDHNGTSSPSWRSTTNATNDFDRYKSGGATVESTSYASSASRGRSMARDDYTSSVGTTRDLSLSRDVGTAPYRNMGNDRYALSENGRDDYTRDMVDSYSNNYSAGGMGSSARERSLTREPYTPSRDYYTSNPMTSMRNGSNAKRNESFDEDMYLNGGDSVPTPPPRSQHRERDYYSSKAKTSLKSSYEPPAIETRPRSRKESGRSSKLVRSSSYKDLKDLETESRARALPRNRARHRTLAYGVSAADLEMARTPSRGQGLSDLAAEWRVHTQVPLVGSAMHDFRGSNPELRGFVSDMSMGPGHQSRGLSVSTTFNSQTTDYCPDPSAGAAGGHVSRQHRKKSSKSRKSSTDLGYDSQPPSRSGSSSSLGTDGARQSGSSLSSSASKANTSQSQNGADVDYKKLWEESQKENGRLREDMDKVKNDLTHTKRQLDGAKQAGTASSSAGGVGLTDAERREKKALERKLSEMEEELKQLQKLKAENERLKSENRALTRVVSKLTTAAGAVLPPKSTGGSGGGRGSSGPI